MINWLDSFSFLCIKIIFKDLRSNLYNSLLMNGDFLASCMAFNLFNSFDSTTLTKKNKENKNKKMLIFLENLYD